MITDLKYKNLTSKLSVPAEGTEKFCTPAACMGMLSDSCAGESDEICWQ